MTSAWTWTSPWCLRAASIARYSRSFSHYFLLQVPCPETRRPAEKAKAKGTVQQCVLQITTTATRRAVAAIRGPDATPRLLACVSRNAGRMGAWGRAAGNAKFIPIIAVMPSMELVHKIHQRQSRPCSSRCPSERTERHRPAGPSDSATSSIRGILRAWATARAYLLSSR